MHTDLEPRDRRARREELRLRRRRRRRIGLIVAILAVAGAAVALVTALSGGSSSHSDVSRVASTAQSAPGAIDELDSTIGKIVTPWPHEQVRNGLFRDPTTGRARPGFGPPMLGQALMRTGKRRNDPALIRSGLRVVTATARKKKGKIENPLTLLAVASAYNWARKNLADDPSFRGARRAWEAYLANWRAAKVGEEAQGCFADPACFNNYKLIEAVAVLELLRTGVKPAIPQARLADPNAKARSITAFSEAAPKAAGSRATADGPGVHLRRLGILADQPTFPLAYHPLSVLALGRGIELLGSDAPKSAVSTFRRTMEALNAFEGPDGDVSYIGRAQQEIWAVGAAVYSGEFCSRLLARSAPATAARCRTMSARALARIPAVHGFGQVGVNVVPRFNGQKKIDRRGLDRYARYLSYNGMTALFLEWARDQVVASEGVKGGALPLDAGGAFVDPERTRFAAVRKGDVWFAVHEVGPIRVRDVRYDFGLSALKVKEGDNWHDVLRPRPNAGPAFAFDGTGPALVRGGSVAIPWGRAISADPRTGEVVVRGGFRLPPAGPFVRTGVTFRYKPVDNGVRVTFPARAGDRLRFIDYVQPRGVQLEDSNRVLRSRDSVSTLSVAPALTRREGRFSSATDTALVAVKRFVDARRSGQLGWTITAP